MEKEILEKYKKAGKIAAQVRDFGASLVKDGTSVLEIAEKTEAQIYKKGAKPAFPINISLNDAAAHYTPFLNDTLKIKAEDYVKIDVGVHIDGYIGDTAVTIRPAGKDDLIKCAEKMLDEAIKLFVPGTMINEIGETTERVAQEFGFKVIRNLTGHGLGQYNLHAGTTVPNIKNDNKTKMEDDDVYACEPFCTRGNGMIKDCDPPLIFMWIKNVPIRLKEARQLLQLAKNEYNQLPFAKRWMQKRFGSLKTELAIKELVKNGSLHSYKILKETSGLPIAQAEHSIIVGKKPLVFTKITTT